MNPASRHLLGAAVVLGLAMAASTPASAAELDCKLKFSLTGWSLVFKHAEGHGTVSCENGQTMAVKIEAKGGGLTVGKSSIEDGRGEFSAVQSIDEIFGSYASAEAHAGAVKSAKAQVMTKGEVSLALSGKGRGWDLGIAFGKLTISR